MGGNDALSGSYTLTYTDLYGSKWTTRPLRVCKSEVYTATNDLYTWTQASKQLTFQHTGGDFTGFLAGDRVSIISAAAEPDVPIGQTAVEGWILSIATATNSIATIVLYTGTDADKASTGAQGAITISHASHRVEHMKEALMTLPDNVIDDISVNYEGTFSSKLNTYSVTFVSPHNSGDQHPNLRRHRDSQGNNRGRHVFQPRKLRWIHRTVRMLRGIFRTRLRFADYPCVRTQGSS